MHHGPFLFHFGVQDDVIVHHVLDDGRPEGYPEIKVDDGVASPVRIFPSREWLGRFVRAARAYLAAHPEGPSRLDRRLRELAEEGYAMDRADICPAEAVVDGDELLADMASSFDVRRAAWESDPSEAELEVGRRNCPGEGF